MPKITVVGPCYKVAKYIDTYVESIRAQSLSDWELILVNDGSPDDTGAIIDRHAAADPRIQAFHQENRGLSAARNAGWRLASAESKFIIFPDPDDALQPTALEELCAELESHPAAGAVFCHQSTMDSNGLPLPGGSRARWGKGAFLPRKLRDSEPAIPFLTFFCGTAAGPYVMWRRQSLEEAGPWDINLAPWEDSDMFCRVALIAEIRFLPRALYRYRKHPSQATTNSEKMSRMYDLFRAKWENFASDDPEITRRVQEARRFYWRTFRPLRNLGVMTGALKHFSRTPSKQGWWWIRYLFWSSIKQFAGCRDPLPPWPPVKPAVSEGGMPI